MNRKLRMGMVGGGRGAFIGRVHRIAARFDDKIELVCGAFSADPEKSRLSGSDLFLPPDRAYTSYSEMFAKEKALPEGERMDFVSVVTRNDTHYNVVMEALDAGFHVVCEKPLTVNLDLARKMEEKVKQSGLLFCLTHNYTGYPMVKEARALVANGSLGKIRRVVVEYPQGWAADPLAEEGSEIAPWRTDPARAGGSFTMGDIGTHCFNLAEYITGLQVDQVCASLHSHVPGRKLDDDGNVLLRFKDSGAAGLLWASDISVGEENGLNIRVYGEKGGLKWRQEEPNTLIVSWLDRPTELRRTGTPFVGAEAVGASRLPCGHTEGYIDAFANIYKNFATALDARLQGQSSDPASLDFPDVDQGVRGVAFIEAVVGSSRAGATWRKLF